MMKKLALPFFAAALLIGGCGKSGDTVPAHSPEEEKAIQEVKNLTPEQQIERIQNSPMPDTAKASMIQKIKQEHGIK